MWLDEKLTARFSTSFEKLHTFSLTKERSAILQSLTEDSVVSNILSFLKDLDYDNFLRIKSSISVSWAWMVKYKVFSSPNGEVRYHIFPKNTLTHLEHSVWGNCHVHDFQAYSKVLMWEIIEKWYTISKITQEQLLKYNHFVTTLNSMYTKKELEAMSLSLDDIMHDSTCWVESTFEEVFPIHTVFDSEKRIDKNTWEIEIFKNIWVYSFDYTWERNIKWWDVYYLPAENWHRVSISDDTSTLFVTDTTYQQWTIKKDEEVFLRWHGKRFPQLQDTIEYRDVSKYNISDQDLYQLVKKFANESYTALSY